MTRILGSYVREYKLLNHVARVADPLAAAENNLHRLAELLARMCCGWGWCVPKISEMVDRASILCCLSSSAILNKAREANMQQAILIRHCRQLRTSTPESANNPFASRAPDRVRAASASSTRREFGGFAGWGRRVGRRAERVRDKYKYM